jgi:ribosome-binding factor A
MSQRIERINELVRQELGRFIAEEIELPPSGLVTITRVETTPDMKVAKIFITILPDKLRGTILELLNKKTRLLHEKLKAELNTKFIPNLKFIIDEQELFANQVEQILDEINKG